LLIPRAVSYSAGFINYFFRGSLSIAPTSDGLFGVLDHATDTGFKKLVVKVKNTTAAIVNPVNNAVVPQQMNLGKFVAVVRFHRDVVFKNDLSAAIGLGPCNTRSAIYGAGNESNLAGHDPTLGTACRDGNETMVVSAPLMLSLDPDEEKEMKFDFSANPIPLAGVDYSVQIVFRGKLGFEDDAIATGYREMSDPMFITRHNMYDYIFHDYADAQHTNDFGDYDPANFANAVNFYRGTTKQYGFATFPDLKQFNVPCWSVLGLEAFRCFDYAQPMKYRYTMGNRTAAPFATATGIPSAAYTRIAIIAPVYTITAPIDLPDMRVERQWS
jgi:hypothetical protein